MKYKNNLYSETKNTFKPLYYKVKGIFKLYWNIRIVKIRKAEISTSIIYVGHALDHLQCIPLFFFSKIEEFHNRDEFVSDVFFYFLSWKWIFLIYYFLILQIIFFICESWKPTQFILVFYKIMILFTLNISLQTIM